MRASATLEDSTEKHPVTPGAIKPARELLGEMLLELRDPAGALKEFEASQRTDPNRFQGLYGAARAAELVGDAVRAKAYYSQLVTLAQTGDNQRPELAQAQAFLGKK
jgi:predicted Zn-dependent protease